ncbi:DUF397 domain-containing protein [Streptomyces roseochromogenus]|uniref:Toxin n=1 Tax=Streptomyces roseochromogenus subsp. oscitans DS 12.976 TaxID=1352936 RepID=V6KCL7_STRRC|nr:DUF397 domain-containing protein [Streptomyces roseochromogenus]EST29783.1 toxin [Streptomyces roseochromogenus subsp. oscitans DS 12.976]
MSTEALQWFKSTYSGDEGGQCLEVAVGWRKSSYSGSEGGQCVEVAACPHTIHIRDSKQPPSQDLTLHVSPATWAAFASSLK